MVAAARTIAAAAAARRLGKNNTAASGLARAVAARHCSSFVATTTAASSSSKPATQTINTNTFKSYFSTSTKLAETSSTTTPPPPSSSSNNSIIPTKHSRAQTPPIAPHTTLSSLTTHLLSSTPGTLFTYNQSDLSQDLSIEEEKQLALDRADVTSQTFEYVLRGHSALLPGSIVDRIPLDKRTDVPHEKENASDYKAWMEAREEKEMSGVERVLLMMKLLERMEEEGRVYVELRERFRSQVANIARRHNKNHDSDSDSDSSDSDSSDSSDSDSDSEEENQKNQFGAPPGPTTTMYDLVLDALSLPCTITPTTPPTSKSILFRLLKRHELDGGYDNTNPLSVPSALSYNAVIRAAANVPGYDSGKKEESNESLYVRDAALDAAFTTFDAMYQSDVVDRNSATYEYLIRVTSKFIPHSLTRSNIIYALWDKCREDEGVYSQEVRRAVLDADMKKDGKEFGDWVEREVRGVVGVEDVELKFRRNCRVRRYKVYDATY